MNRKIRKEIKACAKGNLKRHYWFFVIVCLFAAFIGTEFSGSLNAIYTYDPEVGGGSRISSGFTDAAMNLILGDDEDSSSDSAAAQNAEQADDSKLAAGSRGVLATAINYVSSGSLVATILSALKSVTGSSTAAVAILVALSLLIAVAIWMFFENMYIVVSRRIFLEGRTYERLTVQRFMFLFRVKKWFKVSVTMMVKQLFLTLWSLTVIGGIIKHYSYYMVPYIVAENPDVNPLEAINLSRRMMKGHKWECFVMQLSFFGWVLLGAVTMGITEIFYSNPYRVAAFSEYYSFLRREAKHNNIGGAELMNDKYLFEKAPADKVRDAYSDVFDLMENMEDDAAEYKGLKGFLANWFGVVFRYSDNEKKRERAEIDRLRIDEFKDSLEGKAYPTRLFTIPEVMKRKRFETTNYLRRYSIWSLLAMFFIFSFAGWVWEVILLLITDGIFVNRGVMHGPWLPIYGDGAMLILVALYKLRRHPAVEFISTVVLCGCLEYSASYVLEVMNGGQKWWDYSGYFLNLNGRICAEGLLVFGLGGMAVVYLLAPTLDDFIKKINPKYLVPICIVLLSIFAADKIYSLSRPNMGNGITYAETATYPQCRFGGFTVEYDL